MKKTVFHAQSVRSAPHFRRQRYLSGVWHHITGVTIWTICQEKFKYFKVVKESQIEPKFFICRGLNSDMPKEYCWNRFVNYFVLFENKTKYILSTIQKHQLFGVKHQEGGVRNSLVFFQRLQITIVCFLNVLRKIQLIPIIWNFWKD